MAGITTCTRRFTIDAGHRVLKHESKCRHPHGHRWEIEVTCFAEKLNVLGMVIDFGKIKEVFGTFLEERLDHNFIFHKEDPFITEIEESRLLLLFGRMPYILPYNPTSENLAIHLHEVATDLLKPHGVSVKSVRVWETGNCYADHVQF